MFPTTWPAPQRQVYEGRWVRLTPLLAEADAEELFLAGHEPPEAREIWRYLGHGPFANIEQWRAWLRSVQDAADPIFFTVTRKPSGRRVGMISILRITPKHGCAELGHIWYGLAAQRTAVNTETVFLLLRHLFDDLGYRRVEWKCDAANIRSRTTALRLGFQFEGVFHQHMVVKGRNRDTAWFAMLDRDWPARKLNFERWFSAEGRVALSNLNGETHKPPAS